MSYPQGPYQGQPPAQQFPSYPQQPPQQQWDARAWAHPHPEPRSYPLMLRTWDYKWWKPLLGILLAVVIFFINILVDMLYASIDPRVRVE